jgi:hypothetical protein
MCWFCLSPAPAAFGNLAVIIASGRGKQRTTQKKSMPNADGAATLNCRWDEQRRLTRLAVAVMTVGGRHSQNAVGTGDVIDFSVLVRRGPEQIVQMTLERQLIIRV